MTIASIFSVNGVSTSPTVDSTGATFLIAGFNSVGWSYLTPVDSKSNTWGGEGSGAYNVVTAQYAGFIASSGSVTVGAGHTLTSSPNYFAQAVIFLGYSGVGLFDKNSAKDSTASATSHLTATGTITPSVDGSLLISLLATRGTPGTVTPPAGWTLRGSYTGNSDWLTYIAEKIQTTAAAETPTWTTSNAVNSCGCVAVYAPAIVLDETAPTQTGSMTVGTVTSNSIQVSWPAGADNVAVTSYETSLDGSTWTDRGNVLTYTFTSLTASTSYTPRVRAKDAAGNVSTPALQVTQSTSAPPPTEISGAISVEDFDASGTVSRAPGTITTPAFKNNTGTLLIGVTIPKIALLLSGDLSAVVHLASSVVLNSSAIAVLTSIDIIPGQKYLVVSCNTDGTAFGADVVTAT